MKNLLIFLLLANIGYSQYCPALGPDQFLPCGVGSTTLTADLSQCGPGGPSPKQTTDYAVTSIPYVAQVNNGTNVFMTDDSQQGPFNIGFTFCFFGQTYTQFYIGSNGWISFSGGQPTTFTSQTIPTGNALVPKNCIMGPWQDWHPGIGGQIKYQTVGVAPCRKLIVSWVGVPMFSCTGNQGTFHIVIHESTNYIDNYIQDKPACVSWQGGTAVEGIHNAAGTIGIPVPGRNSTAWVTNNDAWRWTPNGPTVNPVLTWYRVGNSNPIGTGPTLTVTPPAIGAQYTCKFVYPICNAGWSTCNAVAGLGPDTVFVQPGPPNLPLPTVFAINPTCNLSCDGEIMVSPNGGSGVQTISWNGLNGFNPTNLCGGIYNYTITDSQGCNVSGVVTLTNPPIPIIGPITFSDTVCFNSPNEIYSVPEQVGYTYQWSSIGNIFNGQGTDSINVNFNSISSGFIPGAIQVTGYNSNNCPSLPLSIDLYVLNVLPTIDPVGPFCEYDEFVTLQVSPLGGIASGPGVIGFDFTPGNAVGLDTIIYEYTLSGCMFDDTTLITVYPTPTLDSITPHNTYFELCELDSASITWNAIGNPAGYNEWTWNNQQFIGNSFTQILGWSLVGPHQVSAVHWANGCVSSPQVAFVSVIQCPELLFYIANSFTPDGDEFNNVLKFVFTSGFDPYDFKALIYNRWGEIIFETHDATSYWDGTYNNKPCSSGSYVFDIQFGDKNNGHKYSVTGNVNLIR
jgi:gliding motility-associated-like protein